MKEDSHVCIPPLRDWQDGQFESLSLSLLIFKTERVIQVCFILLHYADTVYFFFFKLKVGSNPGLSSIFPAAFAHFVFLCHILQYFELFSFLLYLLWYYVVNDL